MRNTTQPVTRARFSAIIASVFFVLVGVVLGVIVHTKTATAAASTTLNFQARLMVSSGAVVPDGDYNVEFKVYNALTSSGSSQGSCAGDAACLWTETRTSANKVRVTNGYLTVELGSITALPAIDWSQNLYLTMNIGGTGTPGWDGEMSPRLHLTAVPHAFTADQLSNTNGSFTSTVGFVQPTANRSILMPNESGTVCIQSSTNCGFALSSGSGNYIQNGTSLQAGANFNISGTGVAGTALQAPLLDTASSGVLNIGTTNATAINLNKSTTITGGITQSGGTISLAGNAASSVSTTVGALTLQSVNSSTAIVLTGTAGTPSITMNTGTSGSISIGTTSLTTVTVGSAATNVNIATSNVAHTVAIANGTTGNQSLTMGSTTSGSTSTIQGGTGSAAIGLNTATNGKISISAAGTGGISATLGSAGFGIKTTTDSSTALAIQDSSNNYIFSVSTTAGMVTLGAIQATYSGFDGTLNTPFGSLTLGGAGATTILGNASTTIQATSGSFTSTLGFTTPTANRSILLPNEGGTLCIQGSTNCGFAVGTAANYIQNTTTVQSANMYVQAAAGGSVAAVLRANASGTGDILDLKNGAGTNVATFSSTGSVLLQNSTDSATAFVISSSISGTNQNVFRVDTVSERVAIGVVGGTPAAKLNIATGSTVGLRVFQSGAFNQLELANSTGNTMTVDQNGVTTHTTTTNSTGAFQVQGTSTGTAFDVDTINSRVGIGTAAPTRTLDVSVNNTSIGALPVVIQQSGAGDSGIEIKQASQSFYFGADASDGMLKISSNTASGATTVLGYNTIGSSTDAGDQNFINVTKFTAGATGTLSQLYAYIATVDTAPNNLAQMAIYADSSGSPGALLSKSTGSATLSPNSWNSFAITPVGLTSGTVYWLGYNTNATSGSKNNFKMLAAGGTNQSKYVAQTYGTWPTTFSGGTFANSQASFYGLISSTTPTDDFSTSLFKIGNTGATTFQNSANSTSAFQIQSTDNSAVLNVDTTNQRVGIGGIVTPAVSLDVLGAVQQTGLTTSNTAGTDGNKWTLLGTCTITAQYNQCVAGITILGGHDGNAGDNPQAGVNVRVKQQNALGGAPYVNVTLNNAMEFITKDDIATVTTQNDATATVVKLYGRITNTFEQWFFTPTMNTNQSANKWVWSQSAGFSAALPGGTVTNAVYNNAFANTFTIQGANSGNAFRVQNGTGVNALSVDTGNLRVAVGGTFNPQETLDVVGNLQVKDAATSTKSYRLRTSGSGLDLEGAGANLVLSLWSGANYTGTQYNQITFKSDGSSMDFARGFNISSGTAKVGMGGNTNPQYALDVTGEINASVGLRVNGTSVCDTTGSVGCIAKSGSGFYIHNQTTQQTANMNVISAATNSITALFQGASGQTANVLQVNDGSSNALLTVGTSTVTVGYGGNTVTFGSGFEPTLSGNARHQKSIVLTPEYAGAVLDATNDATCASANSGTMTSGLDLTNRMNYYKWSASGAAQCYDVVVQLQVPSDWVAWNGVPTVATYTSDTTNGTLKLEVRDTAGGVETNNNFATVTPTATTTWQTKNGGTITGTYTAGQVMTLRVRMTSPNAGDVRLGNITFNYYSKY